MNKNMIAVSSMAIIGMMSGCGHPVEVPPAYVGKLSTPAGLEQRNIPPSKFRLNGLCITCDNLILVEVSDMPMKEPLEVYMPRDELMLAVDIRGIVTVSPSEENVEMIFSRVPAQATQDSRVLLIPGEKIYKTYAQNIIRETCRSVLTQYTIAEIMENREKVSQELFKTVHKALESSPIAPLRIGLANVVPPEVIVKAREAAKEREIAVQQAEADKQVKLKEAEAALEVAKKQQQVDLKEAETQVMVNQKLAEGVNEAFIRQRWLRIMEKIASNTDGRVIILPYEAIQNPALVMGTYTEALDLTEK